jgi:hypothetical protein
MLNTCTQCGAYQPDKEIEPGLNGNTTAICPACGHPHPFVRLPLLFVAGASGTGKTTTCHTLNGTIPEAVLLDIDILWSPYFNNPEDGFREFFETWLRMCKNIAQSGRPVVLFGSGTGVPHNIESRVERRYIGETHYLALVCDDKVQESRLWARSNNGGDAENIQDQVNFNRWFKEKGPLETPPIELLDTTNVPVEETARQVKCWIYQILSTHEHQNEG